MEYFAPAVQLGLTATPKRTENADTYRYFGEPVYIYSLKDGINDGFSDALQGPPDSDHAGRICLHPRRPGGRGRDQGRQALRGTRFQQDHRDQGARSLPRQALHGRDRPDPEDAGLLRHPGPRPGRPRPHQPDEDQPRPELLPAGHGQRRRAGRATPPRLSGQRKDHPPDPHHVAKALHRRGRPQHPQHRLDAPDQLHDRVQADHRPRHAPLRRQGLLHDLRLRQGAPPLQRSRVGRRADSAGRPGSLCRMRQPALRLRRATAPTVSEVRPAPLRL